MQYQVERTPRPSGMRPNLLRDYPMAEPTMAKAALEMEETGELSPFPAKTPPGMAYVPFQQWEEPYDTDTAFPIGTIFPALDFPYRGGNSYA